MNIFVASLSFKTTDASLLAQFEKFGEVTSCKIIKDKNTGRSKGYGFVEMPERMEAERAIRELNKSDFDGRTISVQEAEDRSNQSRGRGR